MTGLKQRLWPIRSVTTRASAAAAACEPERITEISESCSEFNALFKRCGRIAGWNNAGGKYFDSEVY